MKLKVIGLIAILMALLLVLLDARFALRSEVAAQVNLSPTPVPLVFPTDEPLATRAELVATAIPTFTPTEEGPPVLRAVEGAGDINLRSEPDPVAEVVGTLRVGEEFEVTGRFFLWYRLRYEDTRGGQAWVFGQLVEIVGDEARIPDLTQVTKTPTLAPELFAPTETFEAIQQTPGFELTLTASVREISAPGQAESGESGSVLPTFTFPPNIVAQAPTASAIEAMPTSEPDRISINVSEGLSPIVPIVVLAGLGVIGLLLSLLRR